MIFDSLHNHQRYHHLDANIAKALTHLVNTDFATMAEGRYAIDGDTIFAGVDCYVPRDPATTRFETHQKYVDIQCLVEGEETCAVHPLDGRSPDYAYNAERDFAEYDAAPLAATTDYIKLRPGMFAIFFPEDMHMPAIAPGSAQVKKVVLKVQLAGHQ